MRDGIIAAWPIYFTMVPMQFCDINFKSNDFYEKVTNYVVIISHHACQLIHIFCGGHRASTCIFRNIFRANFCNPLCGNCQANVADGFCRDLHANLGDQLHNDPIELGRSILKFFMYNLQDQFRIK